MSWRLPSSTSAKLIFDLLKQVRKLLVPLATAAALLFAAGNASAGYFDPWGNYHPTCVPGYWAPGVLGPIWVPPVCG